MAHPPAGKVALARTVGRLSRLRGGGGTSVPGQVLLALDPGAISTLGARLPAGSVLISATNGKTTTASMAAAILRASGVSLVHNREGANMAGGIATALLAAAGPRSSIAGAMGLFEVDEMWLGALIAQLRPRAIVLGNLFRDQLDRYGELDTVAARWREALAGGPGAGARLVLCADDPVVADLGAGHSDVLYYGLDDDSLALGALGHAADARHCARCGSPYVFDAVYMAHLGRYHCPGCGHVRPAPQVYATDVHLHGLRSARFELHAPGGSAQVSLPLPGLYNVYNALAASALAIALEVPCESVAQALGGVEAAFGRAERTTVQGRELHILLVKNPVGANEVLRTLALEHGEHDVLGILNDNVADGHDVSWIWDADFELLSGRVRRVTCSGTRAPELAVRLKYAGIEPERIVTAAEPARALALALADRGDGAAGPLYVLPTYTAMLALRRLLGRRAGLGGAA